jgi:hypothetical protein
MSEAFPDHVVRMLYDADEVIGALSTIEGVVAYDQYFAPRKIKAPHPIPMRILAIKKGVTKFIGYVKFMVGVKSSVNRYRILHEVDMSDLFADESRRSDGKSFLNPLYFRYDPKKSKTVTTSRSAIGPMVCALNDAVSRAEKIQPSRVSDSKALLADGKLLVIDANRSFAFDADYTFVNVPVVMSPNEIWRLKSDALHFQAASILAVGEFGTDVHRGLLGRPFPYSSVERVADERMCQNPLELYRFVCGESIDPFATLREAFRVMRQ